MSLRLSGMILGAIILIGGWGGCTRIRSEVSYDGEVSPTPLSQASNSSSSSISALEQSIYQQINQYRQSQNLPPLQLDPRISQQARQHSQAMAAGKVPFSHNGFEQRAKALGEEIPYQSVAENIAFNQGYANPATEAVQGWLNSSGHLKNIVGQFDLTGVGVAKNAAGEYYFTQIFIKRR